MPSLQKNAELGGPPVTCKEAPDLEGAAVGVGHGGGFAHLRGDEGSFVHTPGMGAASRPFRPVLRHAADDSAPLYLQPRPETSADRKTQVDQPTF